MIRNRKSPHRGASLVQILIALAITSVAAAIGVYWNTRAADDAEAIAADVVVSDLNKAVAARRFAGGRFTNGADILTVVTSLQAEVDAKSKRAGFGNHQKLDPAVVMRPYLVEDGAPRIVMTYSATGLPQFAVTTTGPGYIAGKVPGRTVPPEDWTAIVDAAGQTGARQSAWVYDYEDAGGIGAIAATVSTAPVGGGGGGGGALSIEGPDTITSPGAYEWTALLTQPGKVSITVPGAGTATDDLTARLVSPALSFASTGVDTNMVLTISAQSGARTATKTVTVAIPGTPNIGISGPVSLSLLRGYAPWIATSTKPGVPLVLQQSSGLAGVTATESRGDGVMQVNLTPPTNLKPGMKGALTLLATVTTVNGTAKATQIVNVDIPPVPVFSIEVK